MSSIGILHYQVGGTDGVSLEIDKWKRVLEEIGHTVHLCGGHMGTVEGTIIPEAYHHRPDAERMYRNTFVQLRDYPDSAAYRAHLLHLAQPIERQLSAFVQHRGIDVLIPNNVWSVAVNPPLAIAMARVMRDLKLQTLAHHHDFYWERTDGVALTCAAAVELADKYLPPRDPLLRHVVINSLAQRELLQRKGISSVVVPNVFDFDEPPWQVDSYNHDLRSRIGLRDNDLVILQATRIVRRKGIELAVDFVRALDTPQRRHILAQRGLYDGRLFDADSRIVLVLAGYTRDDVGGSYASALKRKIERADIEARFIEDHIRARREGAAGEKTYSLWDAYVIADFVTYPSLWEGWGNQFLEALCARLPLMLFEYPVYLADIAPKGFRTPSLGSEISGHDDLGLAQVAAQRIEAAADQAIRLLTDRELRRTTVQHNLELARRHYSLQALRDYLAPLLEAER